MAHSVFESSTLFHGELLEMFGLGVLVAGASGAGKSELALELISRGHRLVADDTVQLIRVAPDVIDGRCPPVLQDFLEVRGLGILNLRRIFGDDAIQPNQRLHLIIHLLRLEEISPSPEHRLHGARSHRSILGTLIPEICLPAASGCNLAVLTECAVRDQIQRLNGYIAAQDLNERLREHQLAGESPCV